MRSGLVDGRIRAPSSIAAALARGRQCEREAEQIRQQLADPARRERAGAGYDDWQRKARRALGLHEEEARQLAAWVHAAEQVLGLARGLYEIARDVEEDDLDDDERALLERAEAHLAALGAR